MSYQNILKRKSGTSVMYVYVCILDDRRNRARDHFP